MVSHSNSNSFACSSVMPFLYSDIENGIELSAGVSVFATFELDELDEDIMSVSDICRFVAPVAVFFMVGLLVVDFTSPLTSASTTSPSAVDVLDTVTATFSFVAATAGFSRSSRYTTRGGLDIFKKNNQDTSR